MQASVSGAPPHIPRNFYDQAQLRGLRLVRDLVAVYGARESALRGYTELVERHMASMRLKMRARNTTHMISWGFLNGALRVA